MLVPILLWKFCRADVVHLVVVSPFLSANAVEVRFVVHLDAMQVFF